MERVAADLVIEHPDLDIGRGLAPVSLHAVPRYRLSNGLVVALDDRLDPVRSRVTRLSGGVGLLAATADLAVVVGGDTGRLIIDVAEHDTTTVPIAGADSATFVGPDRLVVTAPVIETRTWQAKTYGAKGQHRVMLIEASTGTVLDEAVLDVFDARVAATLHPTDGSLLLDAGEGQDGSYLFTARATSDRLTVEHIAINVIAAGFSPTGDRLLLTPHPGSCDEVVMAGWPSLEHLSAITPDQLEVDDHFDFYGCFLDDGVLVKTYENGVVLCDSELRPRAWVDLDAGGRFSGAELGTLLGTGSGHFAASHWINGSSHTTVWTIDRESTEQPADP